MMRFLIFCMCIFLFISFCFPQEKIQEEVSVDWWVVPLFAIDKKGDSVNDLFSGDIRLKVNGQNISDFTLYKRTFTRAEKVVQKKISPKLEKRKMIFFLFDLAFSSLGNLKRSQKVAESIIRNACESSLFSVFVIDPFGGLTYRIGPSGEKSEILRIIQKEVIPNTNAKRFQTLIDSVSSQQIGQKYNARELRFLLQERSQALNNSNRKYFQSFEALSYALNSIEDNKFVYLFSEGISLFARRIARRDETEFQSHIRKTAECLGHSGAVLFIVNPAGTLEFLRDLGSGEDSLRRLTLASGGRYMEGEPVTLSQRIFSFHRAYYEIAFAESPLFKGRERRIDIKCRRSGVTVHTLNSLAKRKPYELMNKIERDIFAVNLINRNPFTGRGLILEEARVEKSFNLGNHEVYRIAVPSHWLDDRVDIYRAWFGESRDDIRIKRTTVTVEKEKMDIDFEVKEKSRYHFVVYNQGKSSALLKGINLPRAEPPDFLKIPDIKAMSNKFEYSRELSSLLAGAAAYCEKLKQAGFHYFCQEKVVENLSIFKPSEVTDISFYEDRASQSDMMSRADTKLGLKRSKVTKYRFDYQILKDKHGIKEQRKLISRKNKNNDDQDVEFRIKNFLTEKAVFSPVTLLARERQSLYEFRFVEYSKLKGVKCAVIEVLPRSKDDARFVYGQVWVSATDYSVLKIKVNPRSVAGYNKLEFLARKLMTKLFLSLEINFNVVRQGIRFPDSVILSELYKGGPLITRHMGSKGWERLRTEYTYRNYKFFVVDLKVSAE